MENLRAKIPSEPNASGFRRYETADAGSSAQPSVGAGETNSLTSAKTSGDTVEVSIHLRSVHTISQSRPGRAGLPLLLSAGPVAWQAVAPSTRHDTHAPPPPRTTRRAVAAVVAPHVPHRNFTACTHDLCRMRW